MNIYLLFLFRYRLSPETYGYTLVYFYYYIMQILHVAVNE
jgi:hypothetical protein